MNGERLMEAMGYIGEDLIDMAENGKYPVSPWRKSVAAAALLAVMLGVVGFAARHMGMPLPSEEAKAPAPTCQETAVEEAEEAPYDALILEAVPEDLFKAEATEEDAGFGSITYDTISAASGETLLAVFVRPVETQFAAEALTFSNPAELSREELISFFTSMLYAADAAGELGLEHQLQERMSEKARELTFSDEEVKACLDRYLSGHGFTAKGETIVVEQTEESSVWVQLIKTTFDPAYQKMELEVDVYGDAAFKRLLQEKTYVIQFDTEGYRYLSILPRRQ